MVADSQDCHFKIKTSRVYHVSDILIIYNADIDYNFI